MAVVCSTARIHSRIHPLICLLLFRDFQKLIFYYYADHYINFKDLITELYRIYKTRIWLSAINPASFSQHALGQPPSGIGPGAVGGFNQQLNQSYTMMYGPDPDPYGAVPPYRIGYETYTPNYPGIPGVANSFAPSATLGAALVPYATGDASTPSLPPGVTPTGTAADYNYYYERETEDDQTPKPYNTPTQYPGSASMGVPNPYYSYQGYLSPQIGGARYTGPTAYGMGSAGERGQSRGYGGLGTGGTLSTMALMGTPEERGAAGHGHGPSPFGAISDRRGLGSGLSPATNLERAGTGSSGRQSWLPAPIGTRPESKDRNVPTPTSNPAQGSSRWPGSRMPHEFIPGQSPAATGAFLSSARNQTPGDSPHRGNLANLGAGENVDKDQMLKNYLEGLTIKDTDDKLADEMSRER